MYDLFIFQLVQPGHPLEGAAHPKLYVEEHSNEVENLSEKIVCDGKV
jgi:hypothetical protein